jgi:iron complex transport system permease protein
VKYLIIILLLAVPVAWGIGSGGTGFAEIVQLLRGEEISAVQKTILFDLRLPRILGALLVGGMLSSSGCAAQNLFRNDLASPHVLGCVNAAALGAVVALLCGAGSVIMGISALAATVITLVILLIPGYFSRWESSSIILGGVAVNACCAALSSGALYLADERLNTLVFWLLGGFWRMGWQEVLLLLPAAFAGWGVLWGLRKEMDMLLLGDRGAAMAGVSLKKVKILVLTVIALLTAVAVSCCGVIGFVGLAIPHIVRLTGSGRFVYLLPRSILGGALLLLLADLAGRTLMPQREIPVGIITAMAGAPFFFFLLIRKRVDNA